MPWKITGAAHYWTKTKWRTKADAKAKAKKLRKMGYKRVSIYKVK